MGKATIRPVFVVTPARCGSTLLRYLLDSHPDVTSPPELNLSAVLQHLVEVWLRTQAAIGPGDDAAPLPLGDIPQDVRDQARRPVDELMAVAARAAGATVFCDKSLTTVDHLSTVAQCFPDASLVFLYRYPLDMIASGLEASKWGFGAFGFAPFVAANPTNLIAALGNYWIDRVTRMVEFERTCELPHARLYYELLCDDPAGTLEQLFGFLGVPADEAVLRRAFESEHGRGPGDHKIDFSGTVDVASIGRGATLPEMLAEPQVQRIDELLGELDYPDLDAGRRGDLGALLGLRRAGRVPTGGRALAEAVARRLGERPPPELASLHRRTLPVKLVIGAGGEIGVVLLGDDGAASLVEEDSPNGDVPRVRCLGDALLRVLDGDTTFGQAVHDNLIRVERGDGVTEGRPERPGRVLATVAALLRAEA
jgi:Sulfotransferase family